MKVNIGPYPQWWGPHQIAQLVFGNPDKHGYDTSEGWRARAAEGLGNWLERTPIADLCSWIHARRRRRVSVKIHRYDTWNMDTTLRLIIHPMLVQLQATKQGSGLIDDCDVPEHLRSTQPGARDGCESWDLDNLVHQRYEWVLDELIWVFGHDSESTERRFFDHSAVDDTACISQQIQQIQVDREGLDAYHARKRNAYMLFGKYYETFWD